MRVNVLHFLLHVCVCVCDMCAFHVEDSEKPWCHFSGTVYLVFNSFETGSLTDLGLAE